MLGKAAVHHPALVPCSHAQDPTAPFVFPQQNGWRRMSACHGEQF